MERLKRQGDNTRAYKCDNMWDVWELALQVHGDMGAGVEWQSVPHWGVCFVVTSNW